MTPGPIEVTQTTEAITLDCGCSVGITLTFERGEFAAVQGTLNHCKLHTAAPALLDLVARMSAAIEDRSGDQMAVLDALADDARDAIEDAK